MSFLMVFDHFYEMHGHRISTSHVSEHLLGKGCDHFDFTLGWTIDAVGFPDSLGGNRKRLSVSVVCR